jgi:hypothetical protein
MLQYTDPKAWGPYFWFTMRCIAYNFPDNANIYDSRYYVDYYTNLKYVLPCEKCKASYSKLLDKYPVEDYAKNKTKLMSWIELIYQETEKEIKERQQQKKLQQQPPKKPFLFKKPAAKKYKNVTQQQAFKPIVRRALPQQQPKPKAKGGCNCGKK